MPWYTRFSGWLAQPLRIMDPNQPTMGFLIHVNRVLLGDTMASDLLTADLTEATDREFGCILAGGRRS